jgi:hypothetical protein
MLGGTPEHYEVRRYRGPSRLVRLSYLARDITEAILDGRQPRDLTENKLLAASRPPLSNGPCSALL